MERIGEGVRGKDVHVPTHHEGRRLRPAVHQALDPRSCALPTGARPAPTGGRPRQFLEVPGGGVVQLQGAGERVENLLGGVALASLLEADVVVHAHPGEHRQFLSAEPRHAPAAVALDPDILGLNQLAPCAQEISDAVVGLHYRDGTRASCRQGGPATPRHGAPGSTGGLANGTRERHGVGMIITQTTTTPATAARPLTGRVAVVTGATSGIGAATARRLARDGASVALVGRRSERLSDLADQLAGATAVPVAADVTDPAALERLAETVHAELGRVDLVVANAGVMLAAPFEQADTAEWDRMLDTNIRGLLHTGRAFSLDLLDAAAEGGPADLVFVGSIGGHEVFPNYGVYGATKAAVAHLTHNLRAELGPRGVRVKNIEPGLVGTELGDDMQDAGAREGLAGMRSEIGALSPDHIANAIAFAVAVPAHVNVAELIVLPTAQG